MKFRDLFPWLPFRYLSEEGFRESLALQLELTSMTLKVLRKKDVRPDSKFQLEYNFQTNSARKAEDLAGRLRAFGYQVAHGESQSARWRYVVTGWSKPILMSHDSVLKWTRQMCELGYAHDCEFDGWGTSSESEL